MKDFDVMALSRTSMFYVRDLAVLCANYEVIREHDFVRYPEHLRQFFCNLMDFAAEKHITSQQAWEDIKTITDVPPHHMDIMSGERRSELWTSRVEELADLQHLASEDCDYVHRIFAIAELAKVVTHDNFARDILEVMELMRYLAIDHDLRFEQVWFNVMVCLGYSPRHLADGYLSPWMEVA